MAFVRGSSQFRISDFGIRISDFNPQSEIQNPKSSGQCACAGTVTPAGVCAVCGRKSASMPGTEYSYGPRITSGGMSKLPCPGGDGAVHSSVFACHGLRSAFGPQNRL